MVCTVFQGVMSPISFDLGSSGIADAASELLTGPHSLTEQLLSAATSGSSKTPAKRQNLRSRSNSMPVSFSSTSGEHASFIRVPRPVGLTIHLAIYPRLSALCVFCSSCPHKADVRVQQHRHDQQHVHAPAADNAQEPHVFHTTRESRGVDDHDYTPSQEPFQVRDVV